LLKLTNSLFFLLKAEHFLPINATWTGMNEVRVQRQTDLPAHSNTALIPTVISPPRWQIERFIALY
jgi:hypothetical protein